MHPLVALSVSASHRDGVTPCGVAALGVIVQGFVASEAPTFASEMVGAAPAGFMQYFENVAIDNLAQKRMYPLFSRARVMSSVRKENPVE